MTLDKFIATRYGRYRFEVSTYIREDFGSDHYGHLSKEFAETECRRTIAQTVMPVQLKAQQLGIPINITYYPYVLDYNRDNMTKILRMGIELWFECDTDRVLFNLGEL